MRTAIVSGGGTGIGRAVATRLSSDGCRVIVLGRRPEPLADVAASLAGVSAIPVDLTDPDAVSAAVARAVELAGGVVDVVVNNAGAAAPRPDASLASIADSWTAAFRSNLLSAVLLTEAVRPHLSGSARIVMISSLAAVGVGGGAYGAAKAGLHAWAFDLAHELGPMGATVNVVAPGFIDDTELFGGRLTDERREGFVARTLVGRAGVPDDVAGAVSWLASEAAGYVTGQVIAVDGGAIISTP
jgi:3-oxoacyl-[acyl-carrier protein] reductase